MTERDRNTYIGGGDVAAIRGIDPYRTPLDVQTAKKGVPPVVEGYAVDKGLLLEERIAQWCKSQHPDAIDILTPPQLFLPNMPHFGGHVDRCLVFNDGGNLRLRQVEIKTTSQRGEWGTPGTDEIPPKVVCQTDHYHQLLETNLYGILSELGYVYDSACVDNVIDVPVDLGYSEPRLYRVEAPNEDQLVAHVDEVDRFWKTYIEGNAVPPPVNHDEARAMFRGTVGEVMQATDADIMLLQQLEQFKTASNNIAEQENATKLHLMRRMGDACTMLQGKKTVCSWNPTKPRAKLDTDRLKTEFADAYAACYGIPEGATGSRRFLPRSLS